MSSGIYLIQSKSGKKYIGSAIDFNRRKSEHFSMLERQVHPNIKLQRAFNKYGKENLQFKQLLVCDKQNLLFYEQLAIDGLNPEYNICKVAGSRLGSKHTTECRLHYSITRTGVAQTREHVEKRVSKLIGKKRSPKSIEAYIRMRDRPVQCVETGQIFLSGKDAANWCVEQGLTASKNSFVSVNRAIREKKTAYGYRWILK